jgi:hypothetical protein
LHGLVKAAVAQLRSMLALVGPRSSMAIWSLDVVPEESEAVVKSPVTTSRVPAGFRARYLTPTAPLAVPGFTPKLWWPAKLSTA